MYTFHHFYTSLLKTMVFFLGQALSSHFPDHKKYDWFQEHLSTVPGIENFAFIAFNTQEMQSSFTVITDFHQRTFSKHRNVIFPPNDYFCTEKLVNNWNLTSTMLLITIGSMFSGNLRMLNKARDTNAFWASKTLFLSILTYTAKVDKATWNTKCNGYNKGYFFLSH